MDVPIASQESRQIGRAIYVLGALAVAIEAFDLKLDSSDSFPVSLPSSFPVSGALALCIAALALPMFFRVSSELINHFDDQFRPSEEAAQTPTSPEILANPSVSRGTWKGFFRFHAPQIRSKFEWTIFIIEAIFPLILSIFILFYCWSSTFSLFENRKENMNLSCSFSDIYFSENAEEKGAVMINADVTFRDGKGKDVPMQRITNPDGSVGGMVATNVRIPKNVSVPFNSIVCPGAKISAGEVIPPATIIDADGSQQPNVVRNIRDLKISYN